MTRFDKSSHPTGPVDLDLLVKNFESSGFCVANQLCSSSDLVLLQERFDSLREKDPGEGLEEGAFYLDIFSRIPEFLEKVRNDKVIQQLVGVDVDIFYTLVINKTRKSRVLKYPLEWHQEQFRYRKYGIRNWVNCWIPLIDVTEANGCIFAIPGSHHEGLLNHVPSKFPRQSKAVGVDISKRVPVLAKAGETIVTHPLLLHTSHLNETGRDRVAFIFGCLDASESYKVRNDFQPIPYLRNGRCSALVSGISVSN